MRNKDTVLDMTAGQRGLFTCDITATEGMDVELVGAVNISGTPTLLDLQADNVLATPPMPPGFWLVEIRAGGVTILHGHLNVLQSPLANNAGEANFKLSADITQPLVHTVISFTAGPRGKSAYDIWLDSGHEGDLQAFLASLKGEKGDTGPAPSDEQILSAASAALSATVTADTPSGNSNSNIRTAILPAEYSRTGKLISVTIRCRNSGTSGIADAPVWLFVQQEDANGSWHDIGYSIAPVQQTVNADSTWLFDALPVQADRRIGLITRADTSGTFSTLGVRLSTGAADTSAVVDGGGTMQASQLLQCSLAYAVTTAMPLTAQQYADLQVLLERKDELLALLPS